LPINNLCDMTKEELMELVIKQQKEIAELNQYIDKNVKKTQYIYMLYFKQEPNKVYIGKTKTYNSRVSNHKKRLRQGKQTNQELQELFNMYGEESLQAEIIEQVIMDDEEILQYEKQIIESYKDKYLILNRIHNDTFQGGRPKDYVDADKFSEIYLLWKSRQIKVSEAIEILGISIGMFYRRVREIENLDAKAKIKRDYSRKG
jgi:predicted GIY-YIG superfamily endonuclease